MDSFHFQNNLRDKTMKTVLRYSGIFVMITAVGAGSDSPTVHELLLDHCRVTASSDVELAAQMSGVIKTIPVKEGSEVSENESVLKIDDAQSVISSKLAEMTWKQAQERSHDTSSVTFSKASALVAESEYNRALNTNKAVPQAISEIQIEKYEMEMKKAQIGIEKANFDQKQAGWDQEIREKEFQVAKANQNQHYLTSPINGMIVKKYKSVGEWVTQGEAVFRIVNLNLMYVEGYIDLTRNDIQDVVNKEVRIDIKLARNRTVTFSGKIIQVNFMVEAGEKVLVRAEMLNRKENGEWLIIPGMSADMRIQLNHSENERKVLPITQNPEARMLY
jgi:multidrug resistance efflux pump